MKYPLAIAFSLTLLATLSGCTFLPPKETPPPTDIVPMLSKDAIAEDLMNHPELIPYVGTVGGTMKIYERDWITFLPDNQINAYFEDGHNGGTMRLRYIIETDGSVRWEVLSHDCAGCQSK